jgi:hypothetical protein
MRQRLCRWFGHWDSALDVRFFRVEYDQETDSIVTIRYCGRCGIDL